MAFGGVKDSSARTPQEVWANHAGLVPSPPRGRGYCKSMWENHAFVSECIREIGKKVLPLHRLVRNTGSPHGHGRADYIWKKAFLYALVLTTDELRNFTLLVRDKATKSASRGVLYTALTGFRRFCRLLSGEYIYTFTLAWGFRRCSFRQEGQCEGLSVVERVTQPAPRFFLYVRSTITNFFLLEDCPGSQQS